MTDNSTTARSIGDGHVQVDGQRYDFQTYVVMRLESTKEAVSALSKRTGRLETAALTGMGICCVAVLYAVFEQIGLPKP
jgi:hypothetical protein